MGDQIKQIGAKLPVYLARRLDEEASGQHRDRQGQLIAILQERYGLPEQEKK